MTNRTLTAESLSSAFVNRIVFPLLIPLIVVGLGFVGGTWYLANTALPRREFQDYQLTIERRLILLEESVRTMNQQLPAWEATLQELVKELREVNRTSTQRRNPNSGLVGEDS